MNFYDFSDQVYSLSELRSDITDEEIMLHYFGNFEPGVKYPSPFRKEGDPSFLIHYSNNKLKWKDFGKVKGDSTGDAIQFVRELHPEWTFEQLITEIYKAVIKTNNKQRGAHIRKHNINTEIQFRIRDKWKVSELSYWSLYGISLGTLGLYNVVPCTKMWINGILKHQSSEEDPMFLYMYSNEEFKCYRPLCENRADRWKSKNINNVIQGFNQLPSTGDIIIITSSLKDVMLFYELGIPAIALNSETSILEENLVNELKSRFKRIVVNYDNDVTGVESSIKYSDLYELEYWNVPRQYDNCKDPTDLYRYYGMQTLINELAKNKNPIQIIKKR